MPRGKRRRTLSRTPLLRTKMWISKVNPQTYNVQLSASKPLAIPRVAEYQSMHEFLISLVKRILAPMGLAHQTHEYMWYASKLYKASNKYSGEALKKEVNSIFLYYLCKGLREIPLRLIAKSLNIIITPLDEIFEKVLSPLLVRKIVEGTLVADGSEQIVLEYDGDVALISGYIDLSKMEQNDTVIITTYVKIRKDGEYVAYHVETYTGVQEHPALYILPRLSGVALKVTLKQTSGVMKTYDYYFVRGI